MDNKNIKNAKQREWYRLRKLGLGSPNPGRPASTPDVLWGKVNKAGENECWLWTGFKNKEGYGRTWINNKAYYAHRVIYNLTYPNVIKLEAPTSAKESGFLLHTCDNPLCCNPKHLWVGTHKDNMEDKAKKGRCPDFSGDKGPRCKLTMEQANEARQLRKDGMSIPDLMTKFGLSRASMKTLLRGKSYVEKGVK